jgi:hypothetical protein
VHGPAVILDGQQDGKLGGSGTHRTRKPVPPMKNHKYLPLNRDREDGPDRRGRTLRIR